MTDPTAIESRYGPRSTKSEHPGGDRRRQILRSAVTTIAERGFADSTVKEIAGGGGVSRTSFYTLFRDKKDVLEAVLTETSRQIMCGVKTASSSVNEWPEKVYVGLQAMLEFFANDPALARVAFVEAQAAGPQAVAQVHSGMRLYTTDLAPASPASDDHIDPPPATAPKQTLGAIYFTIYDAVARGDAHRLPDLLPDIFEITLAPYVGREGVQEALDRHRHRGSV